MTDTSHRTGPDIAASVIAALAPAASSSLSISVDVATGAGMVAVAVTPPRGADLLHLAGFLREVLDLRGLGRWWPIVQFRPPVIVLTQRVGGDR